jgi:glycosyltransferase involved in cell wall biosynthesis
MRGKFVGLTMSKKACKAEATEAHHVEPQSRTLLLFSPVSLASMLAKGNVAYVQGYEHYFNDVYVAYLFGPRCNNVTMGCTRLVSLSTGRRLFDFLMAPIRLFRLARAVNATAFLTADLVFSWWTALLLRLILNAKIVLMPVCIPEEVYAVTGRSLSGIPIAAERLFTHLCFAAASKVITSRHVEEYIKWLSSDARTARKLQIVECIVDEFPPEQLLRELAHAPDFARPLRDPPQLLYVGRLHPEKMTMDLIETLAHLYGWGYRVRLVIAGEGPQERPMRARAAELGVAAAIDWLGFVPAGDLAKVYRSADLFVSTITGTSLREAGLAGLPVVGYDADWVRSLLEHECTALLVPRGDTVALAKQVARAITEPDLRGLLRNNFHTLACDRWNSGRIAYALGETFGIS